MRGQDRPARHHVHRDRRHGRRETLDPPDGPRTDFYFKFLPAPDGKGFDAGAVARLLPPRRDDARSSSGSTARSSLRDSRFDPVADLPVRRVVEHHARRAAQRPARRDREPGARRVAAAVRAPALRRPLARRRGVTWARPSPHDSDSHGQGRGRHRRRRAASAARWASAFAGRGHEGRARRRRSARARRDGRRAARPTVHDVTGVVTDVADFASVEHLRDAAYSTRTARSTCSATTPASAPAPRATCGTTTLNDWRWAIGVNVWGVIHGIKAFVPAHARARREGHVVNTSSGNGGIAPLPNTPIYAVDEGGGRHAHRGALRAAAGGRRARSAASVLFPGPNMLRTGLFDVVAQPAAEYANASAAPTPPTTDRAVREGRCADARRRARLHAGRGGRRRVSSTRSAPATFWILPPSERTDEQINGARRVDARRATNPDLHPRAWEADAGAIVTATSSSRRDCHAGLPNEQYRDWLDPEYRDAFDDVPRRPRPR